MAKASKNKAKDVETIGLTNQQAVQFIDRIVAMAPVSRQEHATAINALQQISKALLEKQNASD